MAFAQSGDSEKFGRYRKIRPLAAGGMASVYVAEAEGVGGFSLPVALKIIHPHMAMQAEFVQSFLDEARLGAMLRHPNIVKTLDCGLQDGVPFLAMELIEGQPLSSVLNLMRRREQQLDPDLVLQLMIQVCHGLHAAHRATDRDGRPLHLVHRDLKPSNLLLDEHGIKITDFGIARASSNAQQTLYTGVIRGTYRYMSPEQAWGKRGISFQSDIFALGLILFECLTLEPLYALIPGEYDAPDAALLRMAQDANVESRLESLPETPFYGRLEGILRKALHKDPARRFSSAEEMGEALENLRIHLAAPRALSKWLQTVLQDPALKPQPVKQPLHELLPKPLATTKLPEAGPLPSEETTELATEISHKAGTSEAGGALTTPSSPGSSGGRPPAAVLNVLSRPSVSKPGEQHPSQGPLFPEPNISQTYAPRVVTSPVANVSQSISPSTSKPAAWESRKPLLIGAVVLIFLGGSLWALRPWQGAETAAAVATLPVLSAPATPVAVVAATSAPVSAETAPSDPATTGVKVVPASDPAAVSASDPATVSVSPAGEKSTTAQSSVKSPASAVESTSKKSEKPTRTGVVSAMRAESKPAPANSQSNVGELRTSSPDSQESASADQEGILYINSTPEGAQVAINGKKRVTPVEAWAFPAGKVMLTLRFGDGVELSTQATLEAGQTLRCLGRREQETFRCR